jgi:hypothetical protein
VGILRLAVVSVALVLVTGLYVSSTQVASAQPPNTQVIVPAAGATFTDPDGPAVLDAIASAGVTHVVFEVTGGTLNDWVIATATPTIYGWVAKWNIDNVVSGAYTLQSVATANGSSATSPGISITVNIGTPGFSFAATPPGTAVSGKQVVLDTFGPAGLTQVFFYFSAPTCPPSGRGIHPQDICVINAAFTPWGYIALWDSTSVPNGSYTFFANCDFAQCGGPAEGSPVAVDNPAVVAPVNGARVTALSCSTVFHQPVMEASNSGSRAVT